MKLNRLLEQAGREERGGEDAIVTGFAIDLDLGDLGAKGR